MAWFPTNGTSARDVNITLVMSNTSMEFTKLGSFGNAFQFGTNLVNSMDRWAGGAGGLLLLLLLLLALALCCGCSGQPCAHSASRHGPHVLPLGLRRCTA